MGELELRETESLDTVIVSKEQGQGEAFLCSRMLCHGRSWGSEALALERMCFMVAFHHPNPYLAWLAPRVTIPKYSLKGGQRSAGTEGEKMEMSHSMANSLICLKSCSPRNNSRGGLQQNERLRDSRVFPQGNTN